jgi:hypothetical protein
MVYTGPKGGGGRGGGMLHKKGVMGFLVCPRHQKDAWVVLAKLLKNFLPSILG